MKSEYWAERAANANRSLYNRFSASYDRELRVRYKSVLTAIRIDVVRLWEEINSSDEVTMDKIYRYNRYIQLQKKLNKELKQLGEAEIKLSNSKYAEMAKMCSAQISKEGARAGFAQASFLLLDDDRVREILNSVWCADGKVWSQRVWENKEQLKTAIEKGLVDSIARGSGKDELVKDLISCFNTDFSKADRIARTELAYIQNKTTVESYKEAGVQYVKTIVAHDERLCKVCNKHNNQITPIKAAKPGVAYLFHPNCRCDIVPYNIEKTRLTHSNKEDKIKKKSFKTIFENKEDIKKFDWEEAAFKNEKKKKHHEKHLSEFGYDTMDQYINHARELLNKEADGVEIKQYISDEAGFLYKYDVTNNELAIGSPEGNISTLYKPVKKGGEWEDIINGK